MTLGKHTLHFDNVPVSQYSRALYDHASFSSFNMSKGVRLRVIGTEKTTDRLSQMKQEEEWEREIYMSQERFFSLLKINIDILLWVMVPNYSRKVGHDCGEFNNCVLQAGIIMVLKGRSAFLYCAN